MDEMTQGPWRVDDLAREAGITVDTIRYYQREGLLPRAQRNGRLCLYGPEHLERLARIRAMQQRRFSLAAIRALLDNEGLLEGIFVDRGEERTYSFEELVQRAAVDAGLADTLRESGVLRDPMEYGRDAYDFEDLELLRAMAGLHAIGLPDAVIVEIGRIYARGVEATQSEIVRLFGTGDGIDLEGDELRRFQAVSTGNAPELLRQMRRIIDYTHHRTIQRLTLAAIERGAVPEAPEA